MIMAVWDHRAVLARSRGEKLLSPSERAEKFNKLRNRVLGNTSTSTVDTTVNQVDYITRENLNAKKEHTSNIKMINLDSQEMFAMWIPAKVSEIIAFVWNQDITLNKHESAKKSANAIITFELLEKAIDIFEKLENWIKFDELLENEKYILTYAYENDILNDAQIMNINNNTSSINIEAYRSESYERLQFQLKSRSQEYRVSDNNS